MMYYMGFVRNEKGLATALERLDFIERYLDKLQALDFHSLMRANEAAHLLKTCQLAPGLPWSGRKVGEQFTVGAIILI